MTWARFDDRYPWHRKVRSLSDPAFRLDVSAICWCAENLTDGVIEAEFLTLASDVRNPRKAAAELVRSGRWHADDHDCESCPPLPAGAHVIHDYLDYNPTQEKVERDREQRRKAGERGGIASGRARSKDEATRLAESKQVAKRVVKQNRSKTEATAASSLTNPRTRTRTRTRTPTTNTSVQGGSHVSNAGGTADELPIYPDRCKRHGNTYEPGNCGHCADARKRNLSRASIGPHNPATKPHCGECDETRMLRTRFGAIPCPNCNPAAEAS